MKPDINSGWSIIHIETMKPGINSVEIFHSWVKPKPAQLRIFHSWVKLKPAQLRIFHSRVMAESSQATNEWCSGGGCFAIHSGPLLRDSGLSLTLSALSPHHVPSTPYRPPWRPPHKQLLLWLIHSENERLKKWIFLITILLNSFWKRKAEEMNFFNYYSF
jgi:hypothetical protein